ncbi:MAG: fructosamine kinase family protein [Thermostichales cyanobacterium BF4_bins_65]
MVGFWEALDRQLGQRLGIPFSSQVRQPLGGGSINAAYRLVGEGGQFFVKLNRAERVEMFAAEAEGLREIQASQTIRVPTPILWGCHEQSSYLVLEYLELGGRGSARQLGYDVAAMHRVRGSRFGWHRHNTIGATPQLNTWEGDWVHFYRQHRLGYQVQLARRYGGQWQQRVQWLLEHLEVFFRDYQPYPALVHGDLWGGNYGYLPDGTPVIFDPAVYFGDAETDLAMTRLFGGFPESFYQAYAEVIPPQPGWQERLPLYQLYHLLNHLNLFGSGYLGQVIQAVEQCCAVVARNM